MSRTAVVAMLLLTALVVVSSSGYGQGAVRGVQTNSESRAYYVAPSGNDSNNGSKASPWRTISHAANVVAPGDTVHVMPGVYNESVYLNNSGTKSQRIRFISEVPWGAKVTGDGRGDPAIQVRKGDYVDVVGFEVTNVNGYMGIETVASYAHILGNLVHDVSGGCKLGKFNLGGAGINLTYGHDVDVIGNVIHDIGDYLNPHGCESTQGIYVENAPSPNPGGYSTLAANNISYRNESDGITSWHCATQMVLVNNLLFENAKTGIAVGANDRGCVNDHTIVMNNIVVHNGWHDFCTLTVPSQCPIGNHSGNGGIQEGASTGRNNRYPNNLSYGNLYRGVQDDAVHLSTGTQSDNIAGVDPQFVNYQPDGSGDYHLKSSSAAVDKGASMANLPSFDFDNYARPYGSGHDIGPYEWHPGSATGALLARANLQSSFPEAEAGAQTRIPQPSNEELRKFEGLFVSKEPAARINVRLDAGTLVATMLHEPGQPSIALAPISATRFHFQGFPDDVIAEFDISTNRVDRLTVERGKQPPVHLVREK